MLFAHMRRLFLVFILVLAAVPLLANGGGASSNTREFSGGTVSYFAANEGEIWRTDGTPEGTRFFAAAAAGQYAMLPIAYQGKVIFFGAAMSPRGTDVYVSDGAATRRIASIDALWGPLAVTLFRDRVYFATEAVYSGEQARLWVTDGTAAGTEVVAELGESADPALVATDERLFVSVYEEGDYRWSESIWASDGTTAGTSRIAEGLQQYPPITRVGEVVLFYGEDGQVWRSDGTAEGTYALGGESFVTGGTAAWILDCEGRLFRSDGSAAGTVEVWDFLESVQLVGANETGKVFLTWWGDTGAGLIALDPAARVYVWLARETTSGMRAVAAIGETLYFTTDRPELGQELWRSDGTAAGTGVVRDIAPGAAISYPSDFT
ncbi:MAG: hypothetical protein QOJ98_2307, partial [Acidobacteriota bacterium]|nr:hypothetical protein [Acidobacteriota bacterium]